MEKNYLFIKENHQNFDFSTLNFSDIHLWNLAQVINKKPEQNIYFYCKNLNELETVVNSDYIPHITFLGSDIFSNFFQATLKPEFNNLERFWFPEKKNLSTASIQKFLSLPQIQKTSIAIVYNPFVQEDFTYIEFLNFLNELFKVYKNPLFFKDLELQENEIFSTNNRAIINGKNYHVVLGVFGDYYLENKPSTQSINFGILKDSQCIKCEFANSCKDRGLGIIKFEEKINSCIGIKLFQQN